MKSWYEKNKKDIMLKFEDYISSEEDIFRLINTWEDIIGYNFDKFGSIDDSEMYFNEYSNNSD